MMPEAERPPSPDGRRLAASRPRGGAADALSMGGRARRRSTRCAGRSGPAGRRERRRPRASARLRRRWRWRRRSSGPARSAHRRSRRTLADRADERDGPVDPAARRSTSFSTNRRRQPRSSSTKPWSSGAASAPTSRCVSSTAYSTPSGARSVANEHREESDQVVQRRANLEALKQLGVDPLSPALRGGRADQSCRGRARREDGEELDAARIARHGRPAAFSPFARSGRPAFSNCQTGGRASQVYVRQDSVPELDFRVFKLLDIGDWVGVEGYLFRTKTNEFSVHVSALQFLAKCLLPLPEKWHGLQDIETRYRQRYLDLIVNPDSRRVFEVRSRVVAAIREFLIARGFLEVETPMMQPMAGGALARPFVTHHNALDMPLYMRIAPELYLKRLVVGGIDKVFEINRNFRNEGISTQHNPEFTMLEFYWSYADYHDLMALTEELLQQVAPATGSDQVTFGEHAISSSHRSAVCHCAKAAAAAASKRLGERRHRGGPALA